MYSFPLTSELQQFSFQSSVPFFPHIVLETGQQAKGTRSVSAWGQASPLIRC